MKRQHILPLIAVLAAVSCDKEIPLPLVPDGNRIYLECFPASGQDTTYINLATARPVTDPGFSTPLSDAKIEFRVNGMTYSPELYSEGNGMTGYIVLVTLSAGDEVSVNASAGGCPSVTSVSTVPEGPFLEMGREIYRYGTLRHRFTVRRDDNNGMKHYYGIAISGECRMETTYSDSSTGPDIETTFLQYDYEVGSPEDYFSEENGSFVKTVINGKNVVIFEDDGGVTPEMEILIDIPYEEDKYWVYSEEYQTFRRTLYKVDMFTVTEMAYEYLNPQTNATLLGAGLVPPFVNLGNVSGGYGINSCMGCTSTGWIENL